MVTTYDPTQPGLGQDTVPDPRCYRDGRVVVNVYDRTVHDLGQDTCPKPPVRH